MQTNEIVCDLNGKKNMCENGDVLHYLCGVPVLCAHRADK